MAYMDSKRLRTEDPASARMFAETLKAKTIRFAWKAETAAGPSAELVEKAIVALLPLTEPSKATPCENATAVAKLLHDGVRKLRSLQPVAPLKVTCLACLVSSLPYASDRRGLHLGNGSLWHAVNRCFETWGSKI